MVEQRMAEQGVAEQVVPGEGLRVQLQQVRLGRTDVLRNVSLSCPKGSHTAVLGRNGAGKTTLLRAIVGLLPARGRIEVAGIDLLSLAPVQRARYVAYVPQRSELQARLSVQEVVAQGRYAHRRGWFVPANAAFDASADQTAARGDGAEARAIEAALEMTDTGALRHRVYPELSGGEQRRVLLARALASEAPIIALDEPTAALDIAHALAFFERLRQLARDGRTIVTVLHSLHDAALWCDQAAVLHEGTLFYTGAPQLPADVVRRVYGVAVVPGAAPGYRLLRPEETSPLRESTASALVPGAASEATKS